MTEEIIPPIDKSCESIDNLNQQLKDIADDMLVAYVDVAERLVEKHRDDILQIDEVKDLLILVHQDMKIPVSIHLSIVLKTDSQMGTHKELRDKVNDIVADSLCDNIEYIIHDFFNVFWNRVSHDPHIVYVGLDKIMVYGNSGKDGHEDREEVEE